MQLSPQSPKRSAAKEQNMKIDDAIQQLQAAKAAGVTDVLDLYTNE